MIEPLPWMYGAIEAVARGEVAEVEGKWETWTEGHSDTLTITVRRQVRPTFGPGDMPPSTD